MANTMTLISSVTVGSGGASSIDFSSIPATYTDLLVKLSGRDSTYAADTSTIYFKFNNDATSQSHRRLFDNSGTAGSGSGSILGITNMNGTTSTSNTFSNSEVYIPNYTLSNYKSVSVDNAMENNSTSLYFGFLAGLWSNTSAINRITFTCDGAFAQYSTAYLYGIKNS